MIRHAGPLLLAVSLAFRAVTTSAVIPIPDERASVQSLDGAWRFKLEQAPPPPRFLGTTGKPIPIICPTNFEPFYLTSYREDSAWHDLGVPGNWEMAGYSPATYHQPDNASGFYRLLFEVPAAWRGRLVKLNFDGVQNGCEIWCNGRPVAVDRCSWGRTNYHECGWTAWQADLTPAIRYGQTNLLALRVTKDTRGVDCDTGDFFFLGGVHRPVTLFSVPASHFRDLTIRTKLQGAGEAEVTVIAQCSQPRQGTKVSMQLEGQHALEGAPGENGQVVLTQRVKHARLWSAEFPNLYGLSVNLRGADGKVLEHLERRVGIREVSIQDSVFRVNGVPVKLAGICRHDVYPTMGTAVNADVWKKDLTLMKAANFNAVRTSHYPYGSGFYDLCDEMGFYVLDEEPFCWVDCDDPALTPAFEQRSRETIARDKNHPCVVIWGIGNENKPGRNSTLAARITRELDPTRPRLVSSHNADGAGANVEFDDQHYVTPQQIKKDEHNPRRTKVPMIYTENPNVWDVRNGPDYGSLDLWGAVINRTWQELWHDDHVCGTFLWEWQDRAVVDQCPTKYYDFYPRSGINVVKVKGLVDGFRNIRPDYYQVKMAQAPIVIGTTPKRLADGVIIDVTNHYSFTDLKDLRVHWSLIRADQEVSRDSALLSLPPHAQGPVRLTLPPDALAKADTLRLDFDHPSGWNVATYQCRLATVAHPPPNVQLISELTFPQFNLVTGKRVRDRFGWWTFAGATGELSNLKIQRKVTEPVSMETKALAAVPLQDVASIEADVRLRPGSNVVAHLRAEVSGGQLNYRVSWLGEKSDIYELGWIFGVPRGIGRFSWDRQAVWSYYPAYHIGRPEGTALPESAAAELTKVDRPDAFDFNSTKFDCNWASLADAAGRGLCLVFAPEQRQHVRCAVDSTGHCSLIVNRGYCPPRDISSPIVADLYTVLNKGDEVSGSFQISGLSRIETRAGTHEIERGPAAPTQQ